MSGRARRSFQPFLPISSPPSSLSSSSSAAATATSTPKTQLFAAGGERLYLTYTLQSDAFLSAATIASQLTAAVHSGNFATQLQSNAAARGATPLEHAVTSKIRISGASASSSGGGSGTTYRSGGAIAGIVVGTVIGIAGLIAVAHAVFFGRGKLQTLIF